MGNSPDCKTMIPPMHSTVDNDITRDQHVAPAIQPSPKAGVLGKEDMLGLTVPITIGNGTAYIVVPRNEAEDTRSLNALGSSVAFKDRTFDYLFTELGYSPSSHAQKSTDEDLTDHLANL